MSMALQIPLIIVVFHSTSWTVTIVIEACIHR